MLTIVKDTLTRVVSRAGRSVAAVALLALVGGVPAIASSPYVLGGLVGAISGDPNYGWDGTYETAFRSGLQTAAYFGAGGTVTTAVTTSNVTSTASLSGINGIVVPWWANGSASTTQVNQIVAFFQAGGDLLLAEDDAAHSPVGIALGVPVAGTSSSPWTPAGYMAAGPFGPITSVNSYFNISYFNATTVAGLHGTVGATDGGANVTVAYWPKHSFCSTCGALVMEGDVDVWATGATFSPLNANGKISLNFVAYLIQNSGNFTGIPSGTPPATPIPSTLILAMCGMALVAWFFRRRLASR
jgi:hypothetical protein